MRLKQKVLLKERAKHNYSCKQTMYTDSLSCIVCTNAPNGRIIENLLSCLLSET